MYEEMLLQLNFSFPKMNIQLAVTTVELATGENSLGKNHDDRVARVATVLAGTLHLTWQRTNFEREYFGSIVAAVKKTEKKSPQTYEDLVRAVASILDIAIENTGAKSAWEGAF